MEVSEKVKESWEVAKKAQLNAYAKYSNFQVGAALKLKGIDHLIPGSNVENASFGATICAERGAIMSAFALYGKQDFDFLMVVSNTNPAIPPCALCLQVLAEFVGPDFPIYCANRNEIQKMVTFGELMPSPYGEIPETI